MRSPHFNLFIWLTGHSDKSEVIGGWLPSLTLSLGAFMKAKRPFVSALSILGWTAAVIVVVFMIGGIATAIIFGDSDEAYWGLTLAFMLFAPVALLTGFTLAVKRFFRDRRAQRLQDEMNNA
jgi:hypothetical protein